MLIYMLAYPPAAVLALVLSEAAGLRVCLLLGISALVAASALRWGGSMMATGSGGPRAGLALALFGQSLAAVGQPLILNAPARIAGDFFPSNARGIVTVSGTVFETAGVIVGCALPAAVITDAAGLQRMLLWTMIACIALLVAAAMLLREKPPSPPSAAAAVQWERVSQRRLSRLLLRSDSEPEATITPSRSSESKSATESFKYRKESKKSATVAPLPLTLPLPLTSPSSKAESAVVTVATGIDTAASSASLASRGSLDSELESVDVHRNRCAGFEVAGHHRAKSELNTGGGSHRRVHSLPEATADVTQLRCGSRYRAKSAVVCDSNSGIPGSITHDKDPTATTVDFKESRSREQPERASEAHHQLRGDHHDDASRHRDEQERQGDGPESHHEKQHVISDGVRDRCDRVDVEASETTQLPSLSAAAGSGACNRSRGVHSKATAASDSHWQSARTSGCCRCRCRPALPALPALRFASALGTARHSLRHVVSDVAYLLRDRDVLLLTASFSTGVGAAWCLLTVQAQLLMPCGYSAEMAGASGAILLAVGSATSFGLGALMSRVRAYYAVLQKIGMALATAALVFVLAANRPGHMGLLFTAWATAGAAIEPLLPLSLEHAAELTHPVAPDTAAALLLSGAYIVGSVLVLALGPLLELPVSASCSSVITPAAGVLLGSMVVGLGLSLPIRQRSLSTRAEAEAAHAKATGAHPV